VTSLKCRRFAALLLLAVPVAPLAAASHWQMQYLYDENKSTLSIVDFQFASATRGIAVGVLHEGSREKPVAVLTSDAGAHWQTAPLPDDPVSLFFLNENLGWMLADKGALWQTTEAGKNWKKLPKIPGSATRVCFTSETRGFATSDKKRVFETSDGGLHWTPIPAAAEPPGNPNDSAYNWISFPSPLNGIIVGFNLPPSRIPRRYPDWLDPQEAIDRRETPHLTYAMFTGDGGKSWKTTSGSLFGLVSRVRWGPNGPGLGLIQYSNGFRYPSEVYRIDPASGSSTTVFRNQNFSVTDVWVRPDGEAILAGTAVTGQMRNVVPSKVRVQRSRNLVNWSEVPVDYRAVAVHTMLAGFGASMWMATDTGMILKLTEE
jgi:hypothetical protein